MVITLIGYRGCGKSTVANALADAIGWKSVDADVELEQRAGRSIREIFVTDGESEFRRLEFELLEELLQRDRLVLAAGGGAILNPETRKRMRKAGPVIWLMASAETLYRRISGDATTQQRRPNLTSDGGYTEVVRLLKQRRPLYRETATITCDAESQSPEQIVGQLLQQIEPLISGNATS